MSEPRQLPPFEVDLSAPELTANVVVLYSPLRWVNVTVLVGLAVADLFVPVGASRVFFLVMFLVGAYAQTQFRTELRAGEAVLNTGFGSRRVPWQQVGDVRPVRGLLGIRRVQLVTPQRRYRMPVPARGPLMSEQRWRRQGSLVLTWWQQHQRGR